MLFHRIRVCAALLLLVCCFGVIIQAEESNVSERDLLQKLMDNYKLECSRPVQNHHTKMLVDMQFHIDKLVDINEPGSALTAHVHINMKWVDEYLKWNTSEYQKYHAVKSVTIQGYSIWTPPLTLANEDNNKYALLTIPRDHKYRARVFQNGTVMLQTADLVTTHCVYDALLYPYDVQICDYEFNLFPFTDEEMRLTTDAHPSHDTEDKNPVWDLIAVHARSEEMNYHGVDVKPIQMRICMRRSPLFFFLTVVLPVFVLATLLLANLFQPLHEASDRVNHNLQLLAAFVFFYIVLIDEFPRSSQTTSFFAIYVTTLISFCALSAVLLIAVKKFITMKRTPPKKLLKATAAVSKQARTSLIKRKDNSKVVPGGEMEERLLEDQSLKYLKELHRKFVEEVETKETNRKEWVIIAKMINGFLVVVGVILIAIVPIIMFIYMQVNGNFQAEECERNAFEARRDGVHQ